MKYTNLIKFGFIIVNPMLLCLTPAFASDQQPVAAEAEVTFEVA